MNVYAQIRDWDSVEGCMVDGVPTLKCLEVVFGNLLFMATGLVVLILFTMFVIGSIKYLTSRGDPEKIKEAQQTLKYALFGVGLFLGSYLILKIIQVLFLDDSHNLFKFEIPEF